MLSSFAEKLKITVVHCYVRMYSDKLDLLRSTCKNQLALIIISIDIKTLRILHSDF